MKLDEFKQAMSEIVEELLINEPSSKAKQEKSCQCKMKISPMNKIKNYYYSCLKNKKEKLEQNKEELLSNLSEAKEQAMEALDKDFTTSEKNDLIRNYNELNAKVKEELPKINEKIEKVDEKLEKYAEAEKQKEEAESTIEPMEEQQEVETKVEAEVTEALADNVQNIINTDVKEEQTEQAPKVETQEEISEFEKTELKMKATMENAQAELVARFSALANEILKSSFETMSQLYKDSTISLADMAQATLEKAQAEINTINNNWSDKYRNLENSKDNEIAQKETEINSLKIESDNKSAIINNKDKEIEMNRETIQKNNEQINSLNEQISLKDKELQAREEAILTKDNEIARLRIIEQNYEKVSSVFKVLTTPTAMPEEEVTKTK
jgi:hypothetical protein